MQYRHIGPLGNRITSVAGVPGDRFTYYAGAASGGLWKTEDGGVNWRPVFDDQPVHSVGEVEVAPSDPNVVWAGTGEPFIRVHVPQLPQIQEVSLSGVKVSGQEKGAVGEPVPMWKKRLI